MSGKFKTFDTASNLLTLGHPPGPDTQHTIAPNPTVTLNGKKATMSDLKSDDNVTLSDGPSNTITATR